MIAMGGGPSRIMGSRVLRGGTSASHVGEIISPFFGLRRVVPLGILGTSSMWPMTLGMDDWSAPWVQGGGFFPRLWTQVLDFHTLRAWKLTT